jgi:glucose-6-phosphate dehydrogenase assembly protein OpcA
VDFTAIERELAGLWKAASTPSGNEGAPAVMRACQLNLVILCIGGREATRATTTVAAVTRVRPSRVLMAVLEPEESSERLDASISALCSFTPGAGLGKVVCCEQITITASRGAARRLAGAVLPLLLPDLPVVLWRPGDPDPLSDDEDDPAADPSSRLTSAADRVVIDSRRLRDAAGGFRRLVSLTCVLSDLAWHHLRGWRELTAGLFDGPVFEGYPRKIERIRVEYTAGEDDARQEREGRTEAFLLACWVASRLGWEPAPAGGEEAGAGVDRFDLWRQGSEAATVILCRVDEGRREGGTGRGRVSSLSLETPEAVFMLRRSGEADCVTATVTLPLACPVPRTARIVEREESALLCRVLESGGRDAVYDEALALAARLLAVRSWETAA